jgi:hypothetical protein
MVGLLQLAIYENLVRDTEPDVRKRKAGGPQARNLLGVLFLWPHFAALTLSILKADCERAGEYKAVSCVGAGIAQQVTRSVCPKPFE